MKLQIESRWPAWARWRTVTAAPHGEVFPYNVDYELEFASMAEALAAKDALARSSAGEYRVVSPGLVLAECYVCRETKGQRVEVNEAVMLIECPDCECVRALTEGM